MFFLKKERKKENEKRRGKKYGFSVVGSQGTDGNNIQ